MSFGHPRLHSDVQTSKDYIQCGLISNIGLDKTILISKNIWLNHLQSHSDLGSWGGACGICVLPQLRVNAAL